MPADGTGESVAGLTRPTAERRFSRLLGPPASLVTTRHCALRGSTPSPALRLPRHPSPPRAAQSLGRWQTPACPSSPRSHTEAGSLLGIPTAGLCKAASRTPALGAPAEGCAGLRGRASPGVLHPDSRCTPSARALACPASIGRIRWRLVSSGFPPSLAVPLAPL